MKKTMMTQEEYYNRHKWPDDLDDYYRRREFENYGEHFEGCRRLLIIILAVLLGIIIFFAL